MSDNNNYNSTDEINKDNSNTANEPVTAEESSTQPSWNGDSYHYTVKQPETASGQVWGAPPTPEKPKKKHKGAKVAVTVLAVILCCALVSGGTLAAFIGLINNGTIVLTKNTSGSGAAYTITKLIASESENSGTQDLSTVSSLTEAEIAQKVLPSVVLIENYQIASNQGYGFSFGQNSDTQSTEVSPASEGSGIIASSDGYIITNAHVVSGATSLKVKTYDGTTYEATLIGSDTVTDLAVIKIDAENLTAAQFGSSGDLKVGEKVITAGNPGGSEFGFSITVGYVSALNRKITNSESGYSMDCIQTDAAVNPGNSGGALVNEYGQVVGIVSSKIVSESFEGLGFAIPIDDAQSIISDLQNYGYVKDRAALGISGTYVDSVTARFYGLSAGWYISAISNDSLTQAGLQKGDVITKIDETEITSSGSIGEYLLTKKPGDTVTLSVSRALANENFTVDVTLTEYVNN